jgi:hypothetical protein
LCVIFNAFEQTDFEEKVSSAEFFLLVLAFFSLPGDGKKTTAICGRK